MRKRNKKVLIFTTSMGHLSLAQAAAEAFESAGWKTNIHFSEFKEASLTYKPIYLFFPAFQKPWVDLAQNPKIVEVIRHFGGLKKKEEVKKAIEEFKPDLVLSTYFLYNRHIANYKKEFNFSFFNLLCNPKNLQPLEFAPEADVNLVYDRQGVGDAKKWGLDPKLVKPIGWLTRKKFYSLYRRNLNAGELFTILVCGGSWGANKIIQFLPSLLTLAGNFHLILVAGTGKILYRAFNFLKKGVESGILNPKGKLSFETFAFTEHIPELMAKSDLIVGKAGPNLLFESIAVGKPFVAISHIEGTEEGNLKIIEKKKLGWVAEKPIKFRRLLTKILSQPSVYQSVLENIERERSKNIASEKKLVDLANKFFD